MISRTTVDRFVSAARQAERLRMRLNGLDYDDPATITCCIKDFQTLAEVSAAVGRARNSTECYDYFDYCGVRFYAMKEQK